MKDRVLLVEPDGYRARLSGSRLSDALRDDGYECIRCDAGHAPRREPVEDRVSIGRVRELDFSATRHLRKLIHEWNPSVVYVMPGDSDLLTLAAASHHDCRIVLQRKTPLSLLERLLRPSDVFFLTTSEAERKKLAGSGARLLDTVFVSSFDESQDWPALEKQQVTSRLSIPSESKLFGVVGNLVASDQLRDVIWVAELLKVVRPDTHVLIFGDGPEWVRLERFRRRVAIEDRVHFIGLPENVLSWFPALDAYWCAAGDDSIDYGLCEAMRLGLPLIVSDTAGHRELVRHGESGLLFPNGNRATFARSAFRLLLEPELASRLGFAAQARWSRDFEHEAIIDRFLAAHGEVCRHVPLAA